MVHCGLKDARFDGRTWMAIPMVIGSYKLQARGWTRDDSRGVMRLETEDMAKFIARNGRTIRFRPWPAEVEWGPCS